MFQTPTEKVGIMAIDRHRKLGSLDSLAGGVRCQQPHSKGSLRYRASLCLEVLEDRAVPSSLTVVNASGSGSYDYTATTLAYNVVSHPVYPDTTSTYGVELNEGSGWGDIAAGTSDSGSGSEYTVVAHSNFDFSYDVSATATAQATANVTLQIQADPGEDPNALVLVEIAISKGQDGTVTVSAGNLTASGQYLAKPGDEIPIQISTAVTGAATTDHNTTASFSADTLVQVDVSPAQFNVTPTALSFDAATGNVDYAYTISDSDLPAPPKITFAWASDRTADTVLARIPGTISGQTAASDTPYTGTRPGSDFSATPPPARTKFLLMLIDDGQGTTNVIPAPYNPSITVADHLGASAGEPAGTFGRFFAGVPVPGESLTVDLSNEMAVLDHQASGVVVNLGGHILTLSPTSTPGQFVSQTFDPGQLNGATPLTVTDALGGAPLAPVNDSFDVIALPKWFGALNDLSEEFDPSKGSYVFTGSLVNVKTSTLPGFSLPNVPGLWLVSGLVGGPAGNVFDTGVDAHMNVTIVAPINPSQAPTTETLQSGGSITFLGSPAGPSLPKTTTRLNLKPRTLELGAFTYTYKTSDTSSVSLFKGKSFNRPPMKITPSLTAKAKYTVNLSVTLTPTGGLSGTQSSLGFTVNAPFQGELSIPEFTLGSSALDSGISKLKALITHSNPATAVISELTTYLTDALKNAGLLPSFSGSAKVSDSSVVLNGKVSLQGLPFTAQPTHGSLTGSVTLNALTANLKFAFGGKSYNAASANLGGLLNLNVPIKKSF